MSDSQNDSGPPLIRPIPRRPFDLNVREPTPPEDQDDSESPSPTRNRPPALNLESLNSRLLATKNNLHVAAATPSESGAGSSSISRAQSILNLTGSTLMGIYTPNTYGPDRISSPGTPWGTGADIPARSVPSGFDLGLGPDDNEASAMYDEDDDDLEEEDDDDDRTAIRIEKRRRSSQYAAAVMGARRSSLLQRPDVLVPQNPAAPPVRPAPSQLSTPALAARLAARGLLLSALGALYGVLVARVLDRFGFAHGDHAHAHRRPPPGTIAGYDWRYLAFWGVSGVVLGGLLPWFDGVWEGGVGRRKEEDAAAAIGAGGAGGDGAAARRKSAASIGGASGAGELGGVAATAAACSADGPEKEPAVPAPDWSLAVRGIGAFAGIAFAMRKLSWDSTLQVSTALALVNPVLWYLIDRSVPGLLMAGAVGVAGSALFLVPASVPLSPWLLLGGGDVDGGGAWGGGAFNESSSAFASLLGDDGSAAAAASSASSGGGGSAGHVGVGRNNLESAVWMLSVLFCCCVCFGNIGRWLALHGGAGGSQARKRDDGVGA